MLSNDIKKNFKNDIPAGLVVFLVALPLCLGIALASGAPLFSGLITGIIGGVVVGMLSGSHVSVSGPAAGLTVIVLAAINQLGSFEAFLLAGVFAGVLQILMGFLKAGAASHYFPSSVIRGMLAAIGIILILKQLPHAVGYDGDPEGNMAFWQRDGENTLSAIPHSASFIEPGAVIVFLISMALLILWDKKILRKNKLFRLLPGGLVAVILAVVINAIFHAVAPSMAIGSAHLVTLPVASGAVDFLSQFTLPDFSAITNPDVYVVAFTIAIVASIETLLCIEATDQMDPLERKTPTNRELKAQGVGNLISCFIGGLPMTSVIVRSSANINAGARSKMSAVFHGVLLLIAVIAIPPIINLIPLASLAAILIFVGYKLANVSLFKQMYEKGWTQFVPFMVTILAILFTDLLIGIIIGMAVAVLFILLSHFKTPTKISNVSTMFKTLKNHYKTPYRLSSDVLSEKELISIELAEVVSFLNKRKVIKALESIPQHAEVVIDGSRSRSIDPDVKDVLRNFHEQAKKDNIALKFKWN